MSLKNRDVVTIDDLTNGEIENIFTTADEMSADLAAVYGLCRGKVMASLFFEPSTRTRLSFETAMQRLGGSVISVSDTKSTSMSKGESIADMARIVSGYADIIVIRHPWEGAARLVADYAGVPVVNAGDGGHQHPTQTLADLYTLQKERGSLRGLNIALWGDLKYGRTTHSLIFALAKFGANIIFCPSPGLEVPENIMHKLVMEYGGKLERFNGSTRKVTAGKIPVSAAYITTGKSSQLAMMPEIDFELEIKDGIDALYVTRPQKERFTAEEQHAEQPFPSVNRQMLEGKAFEKALIMHPLPRVDELAYDMDGDPRSMYFKQAARGVPVRMALLAHLLGAKETAADVAQPAAVDYPVYRRDYAVACNNSRCVTQQETEQKYLKPAFKIVNRKPLTFRCVYCEHGTEPGFVASTEWHQGMVESKKYHRANSHLARKISEENLIAFDTAQEAEARGFRAGYFAGAATRSPRKKANNE